MTKKASLAEAPSLRDKRRYQSKVARKSPIFHIPCI